ncbi:class I SAM-dependent methyltransferase [Nocardiopsis sp. MG754419]|uniref:class I SAM-dependent DNA methyltransferase n=1 Tax=Nocardiopsis sp. MG754419 TaxID=2259865 RepID=UPI001BA7FCA1|nr:class I SAM-dependent methyltransferase [Nocardiopsis sp. MG754419]MBR8745422.1 SAM-dependent methyltransferase [Nocardiopsis sp. MG754419]
MSADPARTARAYDEVVEAYAPLAASVFAADHLHRAMVDAFADLVLSSGGGPVLDAGCGPGHITAHLAGRGLAVCGVDGSVGMVEWARVHHEPLEFAVGSLEDGAVAQGSLAGALSSYSIIHTPPERLDPVLHGFARSLAPGGHLLVSFQSHEDPAARVEAFDHRVVVAYRYGIDHVLGSLGRAGVVEVGRLVTAPDQDVRRGFAQAHLLCRRSAP